MSKQNKSKSDRSIPIGEQLLIALTQKEITYLLSKHQLETSHNHSRIPLIGSLGLSRQ